MESNALLWRGRLRRGLTLAAGLALTALWVRRQARQAEKRTPPAGKFIEVDGVRLHYLEQGSGPPVILLHGNGDMASSFAGCGILQQLALRHRVIAFDRPGFGYSERPRDRWWSPAAQAELLHKACALLDIRRPIVVAHSFGTLVALSLALEAPTLVRGLVLISGYYYPTLRLDALLLSPPAIPVLGDVMRYTISPLLGRLMLLGMVDKVFRPREISAGFVRSVPPDMMLRPWHLKASAEESAMLVPAARRMKWRYDLISAPVEIFAGAEDKHVKQRRQSARLHEHIPHSRLHWISDAGHMVHYAVPDEIVAAVDHIAALESLPPSELAASGERPAAVERRQQARV